MAVIEVNIGDTTFKSKAAVAPDHLLQSDIILSCNIKDLTLSDFMTIQYADKTPTSTVRVTRAKERNKQASLLSIAAQEAEDRFTPKDPQSFLQGTQDHSMPEPVEEYSPALPSEIKQEEFQREVWEDDTLRTWRAKAEGQEAGFHWNNKWLCLSTTDELNNIKILLVVPTSQRPRLIRLAHDLNGHLGAKKVKLLLQQRVCWPGLHVDVTEWCTNCESCQFQRKHKATKAPMVPIPIMTMPFEKVAIDLVGPFPRTKDGYRFLLTTMDLATRYPEALPLMTATAEEVAEGLLEVFSRHGLPRMILSDQGTQLCGKVMTQLCS